MSNNKTVVLAELNYWAELCRDSSRRGAAIEEMVKHIARSDTKRTSLMPQMMLTACGLSETKFRRTSSKTRAERCFNSLREFYRAKIRPKLISSHIVVRLRAISRFVTANKILNITKQPRLFFPYSNNLRISMPPCFIARFNGERTLVVLVYNDDFPLHDGAHLTGAGKTACGGFALLFEPGRLRGPLDETFHLPADVQQILVIDVSKGKWSSEARSVLLKSGDIFLAHLRLDFLAKQAAVALLYSDACKKLGIDDGGTGGGGDASDHADDKHGERPAAKSA